jgi:sporadic carbohydrate cluster 2OG-Fe(II) oxygenase
MSELFFTDEERALIDAFARDGFVVRPIGDRGALDALRARVVEKVASIQALGEPLPADPTRLLDHAHAWLSPGELNAFKVRLMGLLAADPAIRPALYCMARWPIDTLVGNELAMQRTCNLNVQLPGDAGAVIPVHADVWSGNSPFEVVLWVPLVDCYRTKSMYVLPRPQNDRVYRRFGDFAHLNSEQLYRTIEEDVVWLDVPYGHAAIFSHTLLHGNRVNQERETRWSLNVRFKQLLAPYGTKVLGESFLPVTMRPVTRIGCQYRKPSIHD